MMVPVPGEGTMLSRSSICSMMLIGRRRRPPPTGCPHVDSAAGALPATNCCNAIPACPPGRLPSHCLAAKLPRETATCGRLRGDYLGKSGKPCSIDHASERPASSPGGRAPFHHPETIRLMRDISGLASDVELIKHKKAWRPGRQPAPLKGERSCLLASLH